MASSSSIEVGSRECHYPKLLLIQGWRIGSRTNQHQSEILLCNKGHVTHYDLAIYIKKYLKAKEEEELWKLKYFTMQIKKKP
jgi:hypothetical protein